MKQKGFTLIELLVAIAIIAILMAFALPNYLGARERARDTKKKSELNQLKSALRMYYNDFQRYPGLCGTGRGKISGCIDGTKCCPCSTSFDFALSSDAGCNTVTTIYMKKFPSNMTFGNNTDFYGVSGDGDQFCIVTPLENTSDADIAASQKQCTTTCGNTSDLNGSPTITASSSYVVCSN